MCTVTWLGTDDGYELFFNRDEKRTRGPASPPAVKERDAIRYLAPTDTTAGGTWIGVNESGLTVCVLNHHPIPFPGSPENKRSRGWLVDALLGETSRTAISDRIHTEDLEGYMPFILIAVDPEVAITSFIWDGTLVQQAELDAGTMPLTTSSYDSEQVVARRHAAFKRFRAEWSGVSRDMLMAFHRQHDDGAGAYSVCMEREDARTVSFSHITVTGDEMVFEYSSHPPCVHAQESPARLALPRKPRV